VSAAEPVEVIDDSGVVVGIVSRAVMRRDNLRHRAVFVAVCDSAGRLLVHQRSATKDLWPSRWDVAVGGVMAPGETWADGARRELAEEVGVEGPVVLEHLGDGSFADDDVDTVGRVYRVVHDGPFAFVDGEVVAAELVTAD
jgi:isopentenyldiphosphate isomerase